MQINGVDLHVERVGEGEPVVLVHGGWTDARSWAFVAPALADRFTVVTYDRRGHSRSERGDGPIPRQRDEDDLIALVEALDVGRVSLVGNSYGGSISLGVATRRPELVCTVAAHEPPLMDLLHDVERAHVMNAMRDIADVIRWGQVELGTRRFIEEVALGPGSWRHLPPDVQATFVANAGMFLEVVDDPACGALDPSAVGTPALISAGSATDATWLPAIAGRLGRAIGGATLRVFAGAGHAPHLTHPAEYVAAITSFVQVPVRP
jgi:pimeloyl-ACP methyl ester carboxylesterase